VGIDIERSGAAVHPQSTHTLGHIKAVRPPARAVLRARAQPPLRKALPDLARVLATRQRQIRVQNSIARRHKGRVAGLQRHAVEHQLQQEVLPVRRHALAVELGHGGVVLAVLIDQVPEHLVQHRRPDGADVVHLGQRVGVAVHVRVRLLVRGVDVGAQTRRGAVHPRAHGIVGRARVLGLQPDGRRVEVAPALAHAAALEDAEAAAVLGPAGEPVAETVRVLVDDDAGFEGAVAPGLGAVPHVHAHARLLAVGGRLEVGVVQACGVLVVGLVLVRGIHTCAVLGVQVDKVVTYASLAIVVGLEVAGCLGEAELVEQVVVFVGGVEELGDGRVDVALPVTLL
jgi:hypothetical protein